MKEIFQKQIFFNLILDNFIDLINFYIHVALITTNLLKRIY